MGPDRRASLELAALPLAGSDTGPALTYTRGMRRPALALLLLCACPDHPSLETVSRVSVENTRATATTVHVAFGSDSKVLAKDWPFCAGRGLVCSFPLDSQASQQLPTGGRYLNVTLAFDEPVGCGATKAELNIDNPDWADTLDVSLVDGFNGKVSILTQDAKGAPLQLGPPAGAAGNEKVYGLFPLGCDVCVARENPPCGQSKGADGCKAGTQYDPEPPCQYQAPKGSAVPIVVSVE